MLNKRQRIPKDQVKQDNPEKLATNVTQDEEKQSKIGQSRETGNTCHTRRRKTKQKHNTICVGHHYTQTNKDNVTGT